MTYQELVDFLQYALNEPGGLSYAMCMVTAVLIAMMTGMSARKERIVMVVISLLAIVVYAAYALTAVDSYWGVYRSFKRTPIGYPFISIWLVVCGMFYFDRHAARRKYAKRRRKHASRR